MEYFLNIQELICLYKYAYTDTHSYTHIIFKILSMENFIIFLLRSIKPNIYPLKSIQWIPFLFPFLNEKQKPMH